MHKCMEQNKNILTTICPFCNKKQRITLSVIAGFYMPMGDGKNSLCEHTGNLFYSHNEGWHMSFKNQENK